MSLNREQCPQFEMSKALVSSTAWQHWDLCSGLQGWASLIGTKDRKHPHTKSYISSGCSVTVYLHLFFFRFSVTVNQRESLKSETNDAVEERKANSFSIHTEICGSGIS